MDAASPSVKPHLQPFLQSRPFSAQPVNWGHTKSWQWIPPGLLYPQLSPVTPLQAGPQLPPTWWPDRHRHQFKVISANVRGLRTNIGDLTHNCVLRHGADAVVVTETWLNGDVEPSFGKIGGYTHWARRDRQNRAGGGVAVCFREGVQAQQLDVDTPPQLEVMFFRVVLANHSALLLCAMYRPPPAGA